MDVETNDGLIEADILVNAAGAWGDDVAKRAGVPGLALEPRRRTVVQLRVGRTGLRDIPLVTDLHQSFYFKGEADNSVWVCPLDETLAEPCDAAPEEIDVAMAIDRFEKAVDWPVEAVERKWAGLRTFAPDRRMKFGFDTLSQNFFWCAGQGGMGIQTAPAASLLCAGSDLGRANPRRHRSRGLRPALAPAHPLGGGAGEFVDPVILGMAAMPLDPMPSTWCRLLASSSICHKSAFLTGLRSDVFQPLRIQPWIHFMIPSRT